MPNWMPTSGDRVEYRSTAAGGWLTAYVQGVYRDGSIILDNRERARRKNIRPALPYYINQAVLFHQQGYVNPGPRKGHVIEHHRNGDISVKLQPRPNYLFEIVEDRRLSRSEYTNTSILENARMQDTLDGWGCRPDGRRWKPKMGRAPSWMKI